MEILVMALFLLAVLNLSVCLVCLYFVYSIYSTVKGAPENLDHLDPLGHLGKVENKPTGKRKPVVMDDEKAFMLEARQKQKSQPYL